MNIALAGLGFMAATHIKAYRHFPSVRIAAICNPSGQRLDGDFSNVTGNVGSAERIKLEMNGIKATKNFADLLDDPGIDIIDICTPTRFHGELAVAALRAGKHVICEKPMARTSSMAREIARAAGQAKGFFMPAMCLRFWPEWTWLKGAIEKQTYGDVLAARFRRVAEPPGWGAKTFLNGADSGGALLDLHIHDTDFVQFCFGRPKSVFSSGYTKFSGAIDHVVTQYQVQSRAIVHAEGSWAMTHGFGFNMSYTVNFANATADYDMARGKEALRLCEKGQPARTVTCEGMDGYVGELRHFLESIASNCAPTVVTAQDGISSVEICEAEERSIATKQIIDLS